MRTKAQMAGTVFVVLITATTLLAQMKPMQQDDETSGGREKSRTERKRGEMKPNMEGGGMRPGMENRMKPGPEGGGRFGEGGPGEDKQNFFLEKLLMNPEVAQELGLTKEQISALQESIDEISKKTIDLKAELEKAGLGQARLMASGNLDKEAIMSMIDKTSAIRTELAKMQVKKLILIKKTVSAEQIQKIREKIRSRHENAGQSGEKRERPAREAPPVME